MLPSIFRRGPRARVLLSAQAHVTAARLAVVCWNCIVFTSELLRFSPLLVFLIVVLS